MTPDEQSQYLSTVQAAAALGVSVSTVKRWVDEGILPAHRTAGGHRKLIRTEVLALVRQGALPRGDLAALSECSMNGQDVVPEEAAASFAKILLEGRGEEVRALVRRFYHSGMAVETLADQIVAPALASVGQAWETGRIDVWQEHRATQLCIAALLELKGDFEKRAERNRPVAVGGAPAGDPYLLPSLLAQYALLDAGWDAVNLGPNTPLQSLTEAVRALRPRLLWLSVSHLEDQETFLRDYKELYRVAEQMRVAVALGGQALVEPVRSSIPYTTHGDGLSHLIAFARALHPRPGRPRRGRPAKR